MYSLKRKRRRNTSLLGQTTNEDATEKGKLNVEQMIADRDYTGAIAVLEFYLGGEKPHPTFGRNLTPWIGYCAFHLGDYEKSMDIYEELLKSQPDKASEWHLYIACCCFALQMYKEGLEHAEKGKECNLKNRLIFHFSDKVHDEENVLKYHKLMTKTVEDQMSLAAMHFSRHHTQHATKIYKDLMADNPDYLALNVCMAYCYYKLYDDMSQHLQEVLDLYLRRDPTSATALNLKACNQSKSFDGSVALAQLQPILDIQQTTGQEHALINHNVVVFKGGEGALQVFPDLLDSGIPEARLNLVIHYLFNDKDEEAYNTLKDVTPGDVPEYILSGVVNAKLGHDLESADHIDRAQKFFNLVGESERERDTIPGRQCMASSFFLQKKFDKVILYLESIQKFCTHDDAFNWNYGIAHAARQKYQEAQECLLKIKNPKMTNDYIYISWLARCYIMNGQPEQAWNLYIQMDNNDRMRDLVTLIADDCYRIGSFYFAAQAFDVLERLDPNIEFWEGKKGACIGVFQMIIAGRENSDRLRDVIALLNNSSGRHEDALYVISVMRKWAKET